MKREEIIKFPCEFPIKAIGKDEGDFDCHVVALIRQHVDNLGEAAVKTKSSSGGKYLAVTITVTATSKSQLDAIYNSLTGDSRVLWAI